MSSYPDLEDLDLTDVEIFIDAAQTHGEDSEPDHEAGDLQDVLRAVWEVLNDSQRTSLTASEAFQSTLECAAIEPEDATDIEDFLDAAGTNGEDSGPDQEIGDLQAMLRDAWPLMSPEQHAEMLKAKGTRNALVGAYCYDDDHVDEVVGYVRDETPGPA